MTAQPATGARRVDPDRRDRIVQACLEVIAADGVAGTSHRKVAALAGVPLGSMTYHFFGMEDLLRQAFSRFADEQADRFEQRMTGAGTRAEAATAVIGMLNDPVGSDELVLTQELYTLAARQPVFRAITHAWMGRSRAALERHVDARTARLLDALIEGLTLHRALDTEPADPTVAADAVRRIISGEQEGR
ncbi:TetR family transcriptional regulator [Nakamurella sp. YIM 132087]|uniref:TetR family transcriptional regulator n=1 Tax=Nakamurella alba TaxID=2665158 RepID=A0A7K1FDZ7_9ACTN|nr:TetR family transcriptional regulator [Nakamurella alba]MTD12326.1 TetR family transcriptional regulator [Nakamurella alba]